VREHGCRVTVIAGVPLAVHEGSLSASSGRTAGLAGRERLGGIEIHRARGTRFSKARFIGRAANYVTYFLSACWAGLRVEGPDVVVALTDPPIIGLAAWMVARRAGAPLVMAYQDLFPEVAVLLEDFRSETVNRALQAVNRFLCRRAVRVVALGETMRERLIACKGARPDRTVIIANWADTRAIVPGPKRNAFSERHGLADAFVVMHSGNIGLSQNLDTLVDAAQILRHIPRLRFVFQGDGVKKAALEERARALALTNVLFLPFQPKDRLAESFAAADVFVVSLQQGLAGYIVPSKLYGILAAGRPFVAAVEESCEVASVARRHMCGLVAEPGNAADLAAKIVVFYRDPEMAARFGASARTAGLSFDRRRQVTRYVNLLREVCELPTAAARREQDSRVSVG
jgi:glycosyltransferase involved in cell wall biosynthesis